LISGVGAARFACWRLMKFRPAIRPVAATVYRLQSQRFEKRCLAFLNQQLAAGVHDKGAVPMVLDRNQVIRVDGDRIPVSARQPNPHVYPLCRLPFMQRQP
jgi:hypothetical protein